MRLIDADALDRAFTDLRWKGGWEDGELAHWGDRPDWCLKGAEIEKLIADAPTIEAEPVRRGKWIVDVDGAFHCSACTKIPVNRIRDTVKELYRIDIMSYCPNCGAKME